jgi:hypothetical protein
MKIQQSPAALPRVYAERSKRQTGRTRGKAVDFLMPRRDAAKNAKKTKSILPQMKYRWTQIRIGTRAFSYLCPSDFFSVAILLLHFDRLSSLQYA